MKTTNIKTVGRIISTAPKSVSYYGNPSRLVTFEKIFGDVLNGYTATDAACGYSFAVREVINFILANDLFIA